MSDELRLSDENLRRLAAAVVDELVRRGLVVPAAMNGGPVPAGSLKPEPPEAGALWER